MIEASLGKNGIFDKGFIHPSYDPINLVAETWSKQQGKSPEIIKTEALQLGREIINLQE